MCLFQFLMEIRDILCINKDHYQLYYMCQFDPYILMSQDLLMSTKICPAPFIIFCLITCISQSEILWNWTKAASFHTSKRNFLHLSPCAISVRYNLPQPLPDFLIVGNLSLLHHKSLLDLHTTIHQWYSTNQPPNTLYF